MAREDWADRHVARWKDHWIDVDFDPEVEAITVRIGAVARYLRSTTKDALVESGLEDHEYLTLHVLMIRDTPGLASPGELAADLGVSPAGITGRLAALEKAGWVKRRTSEQDRRRVVVEATRAGTQVWRAAMDGRGRAEDELVGVLTPTEQQRLNALLKKLTLALEDRPARGERTADGERTVDGDRRARRTASEGP
ncbi:MAG: MarR family winged helix-turn-helix transcriptional regulator [Dermatophilaceae bacterium]